MKCINIIILHKKLVYTDCVYFIITLTSVVRSYLYNMLLEAFTEQFQVIIDKEWLLWLFSDYVEKDLGFIIISLLPSSIKAILKQQMVEEQYNIYKSHKEKYYFKKMVLRGGYYHVALITRGVEVSDLHQSSPL